MWCRRKLLRIPWTAKRSNQLILKEINPEYSMKGLMQNWLSLGLTGLISLQSKGLSRVFYNTTASILWHPAFFMVQLSQLYMSTGKTIDLTIWTFVSKLMSLLFNMLSSFVIAFLYRSKHLLISLLLVTIHSDFGAQEHKMSALPIFPLLVIMKWWDQMLWS